MTKSRDPAVHTGGRARLVSEATVAHVPALQHAFFWSSAG